MVEEPPYKLLVTHGQVALFRPDEPLCAELWTGADVARGYIARDGHVDIGVPDHDGECAVTINHGAPANNATGPATIAVHDGGLMLATLCGECQVPVPPGRYDLYLAMTEGDGHPYGMHLNIWLVAG